jgi:hypothetical protein
VGFLTYVNAKRKTRAWLRECSDDRGAAIIESLEATQRTSDGDRFLQEHSSPRLFITQRLQITCMEEDTMDGLIYLIGLIVIILAILSFFGLR